MQKTRHKLSISTLILVTLIFALSVHLFKLFSEQLESMKIAQVHEHLINLNLTSKLLKQYLEALPKNEINNQNLRNASIVITEMRIVSVVIKGSAGVNLAHYSLQSENRVADESDTTDADALIYLKPSELIAIDFHSAPSFIGLRIPVQINGQPAAELEEIQLLYDMRVDQSLFWRTILIDLLPMLLFSLLVIALVRFLQVTYGLAPIKNLVKMANAIAHNEPYVRSIDSTTPRLFELSEAINAMAEKIREREKQKNAIERDLIQAHRIGQIGAWQHDLIAGEIIWSDQLFKMTGYEKMTITFPWIDALIHPDDIDMLRAARKSVGEVSADEVSAEEFRILGANGKYIYLANRWESKFSASGEELVRFGTAQNITARKLAEQEIRVKNLKIDHTEEISHLGNWTWYIEEDIVEWSDEEFRILGYVPGSFTPTKAHLDNAVHPDDRPLAEADMAKAFSDNKEFNTELRIVRPDGVERIIRAQAEVLKDLDGKPYRWSGTNIDITEQKLAETKSNLMMEAVEQAAESIRIADANGKFVYLNPTFEKLTGYTSEEAMGQSIALLQPENCDEAFYTSIHAQLMKGESWHGQVVHVKKDGTQYTEETTISPVRDKSGRTINLVAVTRDISEELSVRLQLRQAQKMESIGRLAGGVAHDFNNMLTVILGRAEHLKKHENLDASTLKDIDEVLNAARSSAEITRQLLAFSRQEVTNPQLININEKIGDTLKMLVRLIGENIRLNWMPGAFEHNVLVDPGQLGQVLTNLCVNARDAISDSGNIIIKTEFVHKAKPIKLRNLDELLGDYIVLTVTDDGKGMSSEIINNIFEPFFTTKDVGEGTGLGLPTVYGIVKQNLATIEVESTPGVGSTFSIYWPCQAAEKNLEMEPVRRSIVMGKGETVLLVEDNSAVRDLTEDMLDGLGYRVISADDPLTAMQLFSENMEDIDLVISDLIMPEMDGRALLDRLISLKPKLNYLFMSGYTKDVIGRQGIVEEEFHFLQKPFRLNDLAEKVQQALVS